MAAEVQMLMDCSPVISTGTLKPLTDSYILFKVGSLFRAPAAISCTTSLRERGAPSSNEEAMADRAWLHSADISQWGSYSRGTNHRDSP